jgi:hypothetical protein
MMRKRFATDLFEMLMHSGLVVLVGFSLYNSNGTERAIPEASSQTVTEVVRNQLCLAIDYLNCTLCT